MPEDGDKADGDKIDLGAYITDEIQAILEQMNYIRSCRHSIGLRILTTSGRVVPAYTLQHPPIAALSNINRGPKSEKRRTCKKGAR